MNRGKVVFERVTKIGGDNPGIEEDEHVLKVSIQTRLRLQSEKTYKEAMKRGLLRAPIIRYSRIKDGVACFFAIIPYRPIKNSGEKPVPLTLPPISPEAAFSDGFEFTESIQPTKYRIAEFILWFKIYIKAQS